MTKICKIAYLMAIKTIIKLFIEVTKKKLFLMLLNILGSYKGEMFNIDYSL